MNPHDPNLVCTHCRGPLLRVADTLRCGPCDLEFPVADGIADFAEGAYYDQFSGDACAISCCQLCGLHNEEAGLTARIEDFYLPLVQGVLEETGRDRVRVLDSGCGNGLSVDLLSSDRIEAWGNDLSALRKWQWRERESRDRLVVADTRRLPFPDGFFDVVLSSGVLEHIGVDEIGGETYSVTPRPERDQVRLEFLQELTRVVRPDGILYLDFPNGAFPIDFWHGTVPGGARFHSLSEGFLPKTSEVRGYLRDLGRFDLRPLSPRTRLRMRQVGQHWYGRLLRMPMRALLGLMEVPGFRGLAASPLNPYLVLQIRPS